MIEDEAWSCRGGRLGGRRSERRGVDAQDEPKWQNAIGGSGDRRHLLSAGGEASVADRTSRMRLVYSDVQDGLVFIVEEEARNLAQLHRALGRARTWGEFQALAPAHWYEDAVERLQERMLEEVEDGGDDAHEEPAAEQRFDAEEIPGHADGEWPGFPHVSMGDWLPEGRSRRSSAAWRIPGVWMRTPGSSSRRTKRPKSSPPCHLRMRRHGYECVRDDDLVWEASGYG